MKDTKIYSSGDFPNYLPKLNSLYDDLFSGGKGFRARLVQKVSAFLPLTAKQIQLLSQTIEFIHNASLLHDDLIDGAVLRRNKTAAWKKYTPEYAVLAGDYLLARVMVNLSANNNLKLIQYTSETISNLLEGEWIQDSLVGDFAIDLEQLDHVANLKTGSLFKWCLRAPFLCAEIYDERLHAGLEEAGSTLGILFQRGDDLLDFDVRNDEGKALLGDLLAGYLNSFGVFLVQDLTPESKQAFFVSKTLEEVKVAITQDYFANRVEQFDSINKKLIELYWHQLEQLQNYLTPEQRPLLNDLQKIAGPLYWRKS